MGFDRDVEIHPKHTGELRQRDLPPREMLKALGRKEATSRIIFGLNFMHFFSVWPDKICRLLSRFYHQKQGRVRAFSGESSVTLRTGAAEDTGHSKHKNANSGVQGLITDQLQTGDV